MLSTNDCYPGCGCDDDYFGMSLEIVKLWAIYNDAKKVIDQIDELVANKDVAVGDIQIQTGYPCKRQKDRRFDPGISLLLTRAGNIAYIYTKYQV